VFGAALLGRPAQQRLQPDLGNEQSRRGAQGLDALVEVPEEELHLRAGQALHRDDGAVLHELLRRRGLDLSLQPHTAEDLHGPLVERGGPGVDRGAAVPLDQQVWHLLRGQQQRRRQPHEAASDDQHGHLAVAHRDFPSRVLRSRIVVPRGGPPTPTGPPWLGGRGCQGPQEHPHSPAVCGGYGPRHPVAPLGRSITLSCPWAATPPSNTTLPTASLTTWRSRLYESGSARSLTPNLGSSHRCRSCPSCPPEPNRRPYDSYRYEALVTGRDR
jgi:hypothetical protein